MTTRRYGDHEDQVVDVNPGTRPVVALLHGGFWRDRYASDLMVPLARDLLARGYEVWNVEYRRLGSGGGWPATFDDARRATDGADVVIGHSAGGHLALWAAALNRPSLAVSQAGVVDLDEAWRLELSGNAAAELLGGERALVKRASPAALLPLGVRQLLVHGRRDDTVPVEMSRSYRERAVAAGDDVELVETDEGHFECLDPSSESWAAIVARFP